jgi:hypothetical protein
MPISRADLPNICNLSDKILRLLEDLPRALRALDEAKSKGQFDPHARSPRGFVAGTPRDALESIREKLLQALAPSKDEESYRYKGADSDITDSDLDLKQKVALKTLFQLCAVCGEWHSTTDSRREETILKLVEMRQILALVRLHDAMRNTPSTATAKRLFALSGNRCSFPGCGRQIVDPATGDLQGAITHINSVSPGGPRYDPSQTNEQRQGVENLILLCYDHHVEIDRNSDSYSVDFLRGVKAANEGHFQRGTEPSAEVATALLATVSENKITDGSAIASQKQSGGQVAHNIVNVGPHAWGDSLPREDQLVFRAYDFSARYMGQDSSGGQCPAKQANAKWIQYRFKIEIFNTRSISVGLMDIFVVFAKHETPLHRIVPCLHTSEIRAGAPHCPAVTSMDLPSNVWTRKVFRGTLSDAKMAAVQDCDEIFLIAKTVDGFTYRCPLGTAIEEA